tara:strand:- start:1164 stop:1391 length:228 start_codon:yes stop_codon:yes gene_type:complete
MTLTNPTPILHQNLSMAINKRKEYVEPKKQNKGLLSSSKKAEESNQKDILSPSRRIAQYVELISQKREELNNGTS